MCAIYLSICARFEAEGEVECEKQKGCKWQDNGGANVTWLNKAGVNQTQRVPKCGIDSVSRKEAEQRCNLPPAPSCNVSTNWWDLFDDTGQLWRADPTVPCDPEHPTLGTSTPTLTPLTLLFTAPLLLLLSLAVSGTPARARARP